MINIRPAQMKDLDVLSQYDTHIQKEELKQVILRNRILIAETDDVLTGWLRYNLFWDNTPFMNMLYFWDKYRGKGYGRQLLQYWENLMKTQGFDSVMTSTASDEYAQHFYVKSGYRTIGGFNYKDDPYEIILMKNL